MNQKLSLMKFVSVLFCMFFALITDAGACSSTVKKVYPGGSAIKYKLGFYTDSDFFEITVTEPGNLSFSVSTKKQNVKVLLRDSSCVPILTAEFKEHDPSEDASADYYCAEDEYLYYVDKYIVNPGTYVIQVQHDVETEDGVGLEIQYTLKNIKFEPFQSGNSKNDDFGNNISDAFPVNLNYPYRGNLDYPSNDIDCFVFQVKDSGSVFVPALDNNFDRKEIKSSTGESLFKGSGSINLRLKPGTYFLLLGSSKNNLKGCTDYTLTIGFTADFSTSIQDDYTNSFADAKVINSGVPISGRFDYKNDQDTFKVQLPSAGNIIITSSQIYSNDALYWLPKSQHNIYLRDSSGNLIISSNGNDSVSKTVNAGTYYLVNEGDYGNYSFITEFVPSGVTDYGLSKQNPRPIILNTKLNPINKQEKVSHYYKIQQSATGKLKAYCSKQNNYVILRTFPDGSQIEQLTLYNNYTTSTDITPGNYLLAIFSNFGEDYTAEVNFVIPVKIYGIFASPALRASNNQDILLTSANINTAGYSVDYEWIPSEGSCSGSRNAYWTAPATGSGKARVKLNIKMAYSDTILASQFIDLEYGPNSPPSVSDIAASPSGTVDNSSIVSLKSSISDPEGGLVLCDWKPSLGKITWVGGNAMWTAPSSGSGTADISFTAKDPEGSSVTKNIKIPFGSNQNPVISSLVPSITGVVSGGTEVTVSAVASDPDGDTLIYNWNPSIGTLSGSGSSVKWTAPSAGSGKASIELEISDGKGGTDKKSIEISYASNRLPVISSLEYSPKVTVRNGASVSLSSVASDPDGDTLTYLWSPSTGSISGTGASVNWTAPATGSGTAKITLVVKDPSNTQASMDIQIPYEPNSSPVITEITPPSPLKVKCSSQISFSVKATDSNGDTLSYQWSNLQGSLSATTGPSVKWTAPATGSGTAEITVTVKDSANATAEKKISVEYYPNTAPVISGLAATPSGKVKCGSVVSLSATASDADGDVLDYSWDASTGSIAGAGTTARWTVPSSGTGTAKIKVNVKDSSSLLVSKELLIAYAPNRVPVITNVIPASPVKAKCGDVISLSATAVDADGDLLSYSWTAIKGTLAGNGASRKWTAPASGTGIDTVTVTVTDTFKAKVSRNVSISYAPNSIPVINFLKPSPDVTAKNGAVIDLSASAEDADNDALAYDWSASPGVVIGNGNTAKWTAPSSGSGTATITLSVKDTSNGQISKSVSIPFAPNAAPVISSMVPTPSGTAVNGSVVTIAATAYDKNGDEITYKWSASSPGKIEGNGKTAKWTAPASGNGKASVTLNVRDTSNAQANKVIYISYAANSAPVITGILPSTSIKAKCGSTVDLSVKASDINGDTLTYSWIPSTGTITGAGSSVKWTAPVSGKGTAKVSITVSDPANAKATRDIFIDYAPNSVPVLSELAVSPSGPVKSGNTVNISADASDPDGESLSFIWSPSIGKLEEKGSTAKWTAPSSGSGTATVSLTVKDTSGGQAEKKASIVYVYNAPPVISSLLVTPSTKVKNGAVVSLSAKATDAEGEVVTYSWSATVGAIIGTGTSAKWTAPASGSGTSDLEVTAVDASGAKSSKSVSVAYAPNSAPVIKDLKATPSGNVNNNEVVSVVATATDADGDILTYTWTASIGSITRTGSTAKWTAPPSGSGSAEIKVVVKDTSNIQVEKTVSVSYVAHAVINDTGINWWATNTANKLSLSQSDFPGQDADYGRDKTDGNNADGHAGFRFVKIGTNGEILPVVSSAWSAVFDNNTGLFWETKTDDGGLHDRDSTFSWYLPDNNRNGGGEGRPGGGYCATGLSCDTDAYVRAVNSEKLCGFSDWRIPSREELLSIVNFGTFGPVLDPLFFPDALSGWFWTSSPNAGYSDYAWVIGFGCGSSYIDLKSNGNYVRLVHGGK